MILPKAMPKGMQNKAGFSALFNGFAKKERQQDGNAAALWRGQALGVVATRQTLNR